MVVDRIRTLGRKGINITSEVGQSCIFLLRIIFRMPRLRVSFGLVVEQIYYVGVLSLSIIVVSGLFIGMVLSLQGHNTLSDFGAEQQLGALVALSVVRELGPVVSALLFAGRAGSALTAEIGLMRATEQLAGMDMMGVDPMWRVIFPRFWAGFISLPILTVIFSVVAVYGGAIVGVDFLGLDSGTFWSNMQSLVDFKLDVLNGIIKSIAFGFVVTWIAVFQGYTAKPTSPGVSRATTRTVVMSSLVILGLDFILTAIMLGGW